MLQKMRSLAQRDEAARWKRVRSQTQATQLGPLVYIPVRICVGRKPGCDALGSSCLYGLLPQPYTATQQYEVGRLRPPIRIKRDGAHGPSGAPFVHWMEWGGREAAERPSTLRLH